MSTLSRLLVLFHLAFVTGYSVDLSCDELDEKVAEADKLTVILTPPPLSGKWVSERCEVRAGPNYLLRSVSYIGNDSVVMTEYHYEEESCTRASYSATGRGRYSVRGGSWHAPGASQVDYVLASVTVIPYTVQAADSLSEKVNSSCPGGPSRKRWRPEKEYLVLNIPEPLQPTRANPGPHSAAGQLNSEEIACLGTVGLWWSEGGLVRVQSRPPAPPDQVHPRTELLVNKFHTPTAFQPPLLRADQAEWCEVCRRVSTGSPPSLGPGFRPPPNQGLSGEWLSARCETRPLGLFLRRRLRVSGTSWHAEYKFYNDPSCQTGTLTAAAEGHLRQAKLGGSPRVPGAVDYDFTVERAFLTLFDPGLVQSLQDDKRCGPPGIWQVGVTRDVTPSQGCALLGITVPSVEYELVRLEQEPLRAHTTLLLGHTDGPKKTTKLRPTAYQPPLLLCNGPELPPLSHLLNGYSPAHRYLVSYTLVCSAALLVVLL